MNKQIQQLIKALDSLEFFTPKVTREIAAEMDITRAEVEAIIDEAVEAEELAE